MSDPSTVTLNAALSEAAEWIAATQTEQAIARCNELMASYPDAVQIVRLRAQALAQSGEPVRAADDYGRVLDILPADVPAMVGLARCHLALQQPDEAVRVARQALDHDPRNAEARQVVKDAASEGMADHSGRVAAALSKASAGLMNRAVSDLRRFHGEAPDRSDVQVALVEMLWRSGLKITTAELCQAILDAQPDCLNAHIILYSVWSRMGNADLAQSHAHSIDRLDPDYRETYARWGDQTPLVVRDVPACVAPPSESVPVETSEEADQDRSAWVDELIAAAAPVSPAPGVPASPATSDSPSAPDGSADDEADTVDVTTRLEWTPASIGDSDVETTAERVPEWLSNLRKKPVPTDEAGQAASLQNTFHAAESLPADVKGAKEAGIAPLQWSPSVSEDETPPAQATDTAATLVIEPEPAPIAVAGSAATHAAATEAAAADAAATDAALINAEATNATATEAAVTESIATDASTIVATVIDAATVEAAVADTPATDEAPRDAAEASVVQRPQPETPKRKKGSAGSRKNRKKERGAKLGSDDLLAQARKSVEQANYDQAADTYARLIAAGKKLDAVLADLDVATHAHPDVRRFHALLGDVYTRKGNVNAALMAYHRALEIN